MAASMDRAGWAALMTLSFGAPMNSLPPTMQCVEDVTYHCVRVVGTDAYLGLTNEGGVRAVFWATSPSAVRRVLDGPQPGSIEADDLSRETDPPHCLLPIGSDDVGSLTTVLAALKAQLGQVYESADYRIMVDGRFISRELSAGRSGLKYHYRSLDDDRDPVAVIGIGLARDDWQPDRSSVRLR